MAKKENAKKVLLTDAVLKTRAANFKFKHYNDRDERAQAQIFWNNFFQIFDIDLHSVARFEVPTERNEKNRIGFMDMFWKGNLLVEHKSANNDSEQNFDKAYNQALRYANSFEGKRQKEKPEYIIICNFIRFKIYDLKLPKSKPIDIKLDELHLRINEFRFLEGFISRLENYEQLANIDAANLLANVVKHIKADFKDQEELRLFMMRLLFCLFAEDTNIFTKFQFQKYVELHTEPSGKDLGKKLNTLFDILNIPINDRPSNISDTLAAFPYVNGALFEGKIKNMPLMDSSIRNTIINCCNFDWTPISPDIFGSLFQTILDDVAKNQRRSMGAHYTSQENIMKIIKPLFLDDLRKELTEAKGDKRKIEKFRVKLSNLKFLDPACGCGNFLIIAYREIRLLDIKAIELLGDIKAVAYLSSYVHLENYFGIEYDAFSSYIAKVALWLMEHKCNMMLLQSCGINIQTIPLKEAAKIVNGNALRLDWKEAFEGKQVDYILGNPPFIGKHLQSEEQKEDVGLVFKDVQGAGLMDYVACWYVKAAQYIQGTKIKVAFVSTNSIAQGEQVGVLWKEMFEKYKTKIHFAHQTFHWNNEASGVAAVHCVIIGFANFDTNEKYIYEYDNINAEPTELKAKNINPYLVEGSDMYIEARTKPICNVPKMVYGSKIVDDKNFLLNDEEKAEYIKKEPSGAKFIKPILSGDEFINGKNRWCFWLVDAKPNEVKELPLLMQRVKKVKDFRLKSAKKQTVELANTPMLFAEIRQPDSEFLLIPRTSSENRNYIPFGFYSKDHIVSDSCTCMPKATYFDFGMLTSKMHMAWVKYVCGRLKSDYRYSNSIIYNNYPFPQNVSKENKANVEKAVKEVLNIREKHTKAGSTLADMYSNLTMPKDLIEAHKVLDKAVDACYGKMTFTNDAKRIAFLFELYEELVKKGK